MAVTYRIVGDLLEMAFVGDYLPDDIPRQFLAALNDPACPKRVALFVDVTRSTSLAARSSEDIKRVAEFLGPYSDRIGGRCAVLATEDIHFGLSRMGSVYSAGVGVETRVFRDRDEALAWLKSPREP